LRVWQVSDGAQLHLHKLGALSQGPVGVSPDGRRAAVAAGKKLLWVDLTSGEIVREVTGDPYGHFSRVAAVGDGRHFVAAAEGGKADTKGVAAYLFEWETGKAVRAFPHDDTLSALAVSPDGKRLYTQGYSRGLLHVWDLEGPKPETPTPPVPSTPKGDR